jgi:hypothetical protein
MWTADPRATVLYAHCILYPVPTDPVTAEKQRIEQPWERTGKLSPPARRKVEAYLAAHRLDVRSDLEEVEDVYMERDPVFETADRGSLAFRYFDGGMLSLHVRLTPLSVAEVVALVRLGDFFIQDEEIMTRDRRRVVALSEKTAAAVPAEMGEVLVVAPEDLGGVLYDWAAG